MSMQNAYDRVSRGWVDAQVIGMRGGVHRVERIEADHDGHKDGELDPCVSRDGAEQEGVEDDGDRG